MAAARATPTLGNASRSVSPAPAVTSAAAPDLRRFARPPSTSSTGSEAGSFANSPVQVDACTGRALLNRV